MVHDNARQSHRGLNKECRVVDKTGSKWDLIETVKRQLSYFEHTVRKPKPHLEKDLIRETRTGQRRRRRPNTSWLYSVKSWTGLLLEKATDTDNWRRLVHDAGNTETGNDRRSEQNMYKSATIGHYYICGQHTRSCTQFFILAYILFIHNVRCPPSECTKQIKCGRT